jgi:hypothetical protein
VAGWFSFEGMGATAGDILARDVVCEWLDEAGLPFDVATAAPFTGGVNWQDADASHYTHVIFVCGPFGNGEPIVSFLEHFQGRTLIGVDLSMLQSLDDWNPFDLLLERDSSATARPDLSFLSQAARVPVIGLILVHPQREYGDRGRHDRAHDIIRQMLADVDAAIVPIDTRLDVNAGGLRTPAEIESLISRMDVVVTTRLHGMVLALKNGVPAIVVDPIAGGAKITRQAEVIGWPIVFPGDSVSVDDLERAYDYCLTRGAADRARACAKGAIAKLERAHADFVAALDARHSGKW